MKKKTLLTLVVLGVLTASNFCLTGAMTASAAEDDGRFCNTGGGVVEESETIYYYRKDTVEYDIKSKVPNYGPISNTGCANVAGAILLGYYDRFCEELIPDCKTYIQIGNGIKYYSGTTGTDAAMQALYTLMGTDVGGAGTTFNGFQNGMNSYVSSHGYTYYSEDVNNIDFNKYKSAVENDKPVAVFLTDYSLKITGDYGNNYETIKSDHSYVGHVVIAYGYKIDYYYDSYNSLITTRTYLRVASGHVTYGLTYLCLDGKSTVNRAISVTIS